MPDSLQVATGSVVTLTWQATNAPDGVELTEPAKGTPQKLAATVSTADVTASAASQDYALVALNGSARSAPSTVHVSTHTDAVVSSHSYVTHPGDAPQAGAGTAVVIAAVQWQETLGEWPANSPASHFKVNVTVTANCQVVFTPSAAGDKAPSENDAKAAATQGILDYVTANVEEPLLSALGSALADPSSLSVTAAGMTQLQAYQQAREKGESTYTFGQMTLFQLNLSVPQLQTAPLSFALTLAAVQVSLAKPLDSGLGVLSGTTTVTIVDASAGPKNIDGQIGLAFQGSVSVQLNLNLIAVTALDLLKRAGIAIAEDVLFDTGVSFSEVGGEVVVDGVVACASVAGAVAVIAFVGYEVGKSFDLLVKADAEFDFGRLLKDDDTYVPGVMAEVRKQVDAGVAMGLLGGTILVVTGEITVQGGKLGTDTRLKMQEALSARNPNLSADKFETLFAAYMAKNEAAITGALDKQIKELTELFSWMQIIRNGMPKSMPGDEVEKVDGRNTLSPWTVVWQEIFGDKIDDLMSTITDVTWKDDSNVNLSGTVPGQDKWKVLQQSEAWLVANS